ncbi:concanavalin A-like lectin/glucanase [Basidiobolus meristosporus CBS 931.73]|uniref:Concanavalin A-like lectin/glucanase n=1 Tax=Basidiobolus meristosporus CBS 931.73 TaxID=1314790 RepID=A0A1Y1YK55_9FUNG|nr:concanavalin A-like lectin/glucanase [Basidiobolus meristosporus CBS 931.73]|eukprot:ORX97974.1 concanavalin A-like lectin/glucanase [Basidiobolus meristosporus CBS 931.73]
MHLTAKLLIAFTLSSIFSRSDAAICKEAVDTFSGRSAIPLSTEGDVRRENGYLVLRVVKGDRHPSGGWVGDGARATMTQQLQYARITARLRTAGTRGIVSAMFTMANDKDEMDLEWLGGRPRQLLSNFFYKGDLIFTNSKEHNINVDSSKQFVNYTLDWRPDQVSWLINGQVVRTLRKDQTYDRRINAYRFPSSPAKVEFSVWDGGDSDEDGTSEWAGGRVNWEDRHINDDGRLDMKVDFLEIKCHP